MEWTEMVLGMILLMSVGEKKRCKFEEIAHSESKKLTEVLMCIFGIIELFVK